MKANKIGEINYNKESLGGYKMLIIEYHSNKNMIIEFQDKYKAKVKCAYKEFKNGSIKNPYHPSVYGVGYVGIGKYNKKEYPKIYDHWHDMIKRCYDPYKLNDNPTYRDCFIEDYLLCFQNFARWYEENYYKCKEEKMHLDKDILLKGNKIYSRETMIFVPQRINKLFTKSDSKRGKYPIGVHWSKKDNKFRSQCSIIKEGKKKMICLGLYNTVEEAFLEYKKFKEKYIKQVADEYKYYIPQRLYNALYLYDVEVMD